MSYNYQRYVAQYHTAQARGWKDGLTGITHPDCGPYKEESAFYKAYWDAYRKGAEYVGEDS